MLYHGLALVPDYTCVIILYKARASMSNDKIGTKIQRMVSNKKDGVFLELELEYHPTNEIEQCHNLGIFNNPSNGRLD